MKTHKHILIAILLIAVLPITVFSQNNILGGRINGNFQMDAQYYRPDSLIGAKPVSEKMLMNSWTNVIYTSGNFNAGMRFETYLNPINGYDIKYKGSGIPYWHVDYKTGQFQITAGNIYEQFGSGMIFRTYEEHNLGLDNSLYGLRVKFRPYKGIDLKAIYGTQRYYWEKGPGIVRGIDADVFLNDLIPSFENSPLKINLGGSFVSKYEDNEQIYNKYKDSNHPNELLILPLNVGAGAGRINMIYKNFSLTSEYVRKVNDPNDKNGYIYKPGEAMLVSLSYNQRGFGAFIQAKRLDNMTFKSRRTGADKALDINYLPSITKQQAYSLASLYPYATLPNNEMGLQAQINYKIKRNTLLGGKYGVDLSLSGSIVNGIEKTPIPGEEIFETTNGTLGYTSSFFKPGEDNYYKDLILEIGHRFTKSYKLIFTYMYQGIDNFVVQGHGDYMKAHIFIADNSYRITTKQSIRFEAQAMFTKQEEGDWAYALVEYSVAPKWFFSVANMYNFGNPNPDQRLHYPLVAMAYNNGANRIQISYGRQRKGVVCVGGVCREMPASNGLTVSLTTNF